MTKAPSPLTYKDTGVDIDAGEDVVRAIGPMVKSTARTGSTPSLGGFGALFDLKATGYQDPILVSATDGVGTKLKVAIESGVHGTVGIDLVAMCVNDLVVQGAEPLFFLDYFGTGHLQPDVAASVVSGIADGCRQAGCALVGGETAELPGLYAKGDYDLAGFSVGAVERTEILPQADIEAGDIVIGIASSGAHSNGYSLIRKIFENANLNFSDDAPFAAGKTVSDVLLTPTRIYVKSCLALHKAKLVKAFAHITGGGLIENIPRILPDNVAVTLDAEQWQYPDLFRWLQQEARINSHEMARTFNCGVGMICVVAPAEADALVAHLTEQGETAAIIGTLTERTGDPVTFDGHLAL